jgi:hypothetical protein
MPADFSGEPKTLWLTEKESDRGMRLIEAFWFRDRAGRQWDAAKGAKIDGATIPRALWTWVGSPYTGDYRRASVVHDVACVAAGSGDSPARRKADRMFYEACRAGGCSVQQSIILYVGVRIGAWYGGALVEQEEDGPRISRTQFEEQLQSDFRDTAERVLSQGEVDDAEEVERRTDAAFTAVAARRVAVAEAVTMAASLQR